MNHREILLRYKFKVNKRQIAGRFTSKSLKLNTSIVYSPINVQSTSHKQTTIKMQCKIALVYAIHRGREHVVEQVDVHSGIEWIKTSTRTRELIEPSKNLAFTFAKRRSSFLRERIRSEERFLWKHWKIVCPPLCQCWGARVKRKQTRCFAIECNSGLHRIALHLCSRFGSV